MADVLGVPVHVPAGDREQRARARRSAPGPVRGCTPACTSCGPGCASRAATFEPDPAAVAAYDERYATWREVYPRMLDISEDGLLRPLWRAAGA